MRIAMFTETFLPSVNGVVTRLRETIRWLRESGDEVILFAPGDPPPSLYGAQVVGVSGFSLPLYREMSLALPRPSMRRPLTRFRPDLIHAVNPLVLGMAGVYYSQRLDVPLVASFHTNLPRYLRHYRLGVFENLAWELIRAAHNQACVNLCVSSAVEADLRAHGIRQVQAGWRGGVDTELFHPGRRSPQARARLSGGDVEAPLLLYVGRLSAEKDVGFIRGILDGLPGARLALVGDGPHRPALEQHFSGRPVCFAGYLAGEELAAAYASSDLLVFPSQTDTFGLVLLEAAASGCPVLAARAGGAPDIVQEGVGGLLFEPGDTEGAIAAARRLLDPGVDRELLRAGARMHGEAWNWQSATDELRGHYARALGAATLTPAA